MRFMTESLRSALVFPGQGSQVQVLTQHVGMCADLMHLPQALAVVQECEQALGQKLGHLMTEGPPQVLQSTPNAQPGFYF